MLRKNISLMLTLILAINIFSPTALAADTAPSAENGIEYINRWIGVSLTLPASWEGKYAIIEYNDSFEVRHSLSMETANGAGLLFYVFRTEAILEGTLGGAGARFIAAQTPSFYYILAGPASVEFSEESEAEYNEMYADRAWILQTVQAIPIFQLGTDEAIPGLNVSVNPPFVQLCGVELDAPQPFIEDGVTWLPLRAIAEAAWITVTWNDYWGNVILEYDSSEIKINTYGGNTILKDNRTFVTYKFLAYLFDRYNIGFSGELL